MHYIVGSFARSSVVLAAVPSLGPRSLSWVRRLLLETATSSPIECRIGSKDGMDRVGSVRAGRVPPVPPTRYVKQITSSSVTAPEVLPLGGISPISAYATLPSSEGPVERNFCFVHFGVTAVRLRLGRTATRSSRSAGYHPFRHSARLPFPEGSVSRLFMHLRQWGHRFFRKRQTSDEKGPLRSGETQRPEEPGLT
ncbi:hypothetical protein TNIN_286141 [Trichonephila inaurata madagascariensis]|uniref:Uncharacterized protein n=1 Tax=Trichonephila inaurata madagascariensis TaxID=2747483 RepID=A0A8X6WT33_9ARAC|nr:hypothetical protein TNIN_286141 [Trichonephila inaurata madagascariensis]